MMWTSGIVMLWAVGVLHPVNKLKTHLNNASLEP